MAGKRKFITQKELDFIEHINKELHQDIVRQYCYYYPIVIDKEDDDNDVYGEKVQKQVLSPIKIFPRILYGTPEGVINEFGADIRHEIEIYIHKQECEDKNFKPKVGDFINYAGKFFELTTVVTTSLPLGRPETQIEFKCSGIQARKLQFDFPIPEADSLTNQFSGSLDVNASVGTDALDQWANVPENEDT